MAELMHDIEWNEPILPRVDVPEWTEEVKSRMGRVPDALQRVSRSPWLRETYLKWVLYKTRVAPQKLVDIGILVTSQENACRYCYGIARAQLRLFGYSEKMIVAIEREMHLAQLDESENAVVRFCRSLSRSNPRPPREERDHLVRMGYPDRTVAEIAFLIGTGCFINRVSTFLACRPDTRLERLPDSLLGRLLRPLIARRFQAMRKSEDGQLDGAVDSFAGVVMSLEGLPAAKSLRDTMTAAFDSEVLSRELKVLMFAVVARSLACTFCQSETRDMALRLGLREEEYDRALASLTAPGLTAQEAAILAWTRETVHYQTGPMQRRVRALSEEVDEERLLEAVGIAALANTVVRIAVLLGE